MRSEANKHDTNKARLALLSSAALFGIGEVLAYGAIKYDADNWRKGARWSRYLGAALRHVVAFLGGEDLDPESGLPHVDHALCCLMFLSEFQKHGTGTDDRWREPRVPSGGVAAFFGTFPDDEATCNRYTWVDEAVARGPTERRAHIAELDKVESEVCREMKFVVGEGAHYCGLNKGHSNRHKSDGPGFRYWDPPNLPPHSKFAEAGYAEEPLPICNRCGAVGHTTCEAPLGPMLDAT